MCTLRLLCSLVLVLASLPALAQTGSASQTPTFYIYHGRHVALEPDFSAVAVRVSPAITGAGVQGFLRGHDVATVEAVALPGWFIVRSTKPAVTAAGIREMMLRVLDVPAVEFASPVFHRPHGALMLIGPELLVRFHQSAIGEAEALLAKDPAGLTILDRRFGTFSGGFRIRSGSRNGFDVLAAANRLAADERVLWAEPDAVQSGTGEYIPDDPGFVFLWGIRNTGQTGGTAGIDMDGDRAWDFLTGSSSVKVLVIDVGVQQDHPDIHQAAGYDFVLNVAGGDPANGCDNHGTAVAGCISAVMDNGTGTAGIAPGCNVLSARVMRADVPCTGRWWTMNSYTVNALAWGNSNGARVSNNSNAYGSPSDAIADEYQATYDSGMVHFASAGNDTDASLSWPASLPTVNAVAAIDDDGTLAVFSNHGPGLDFSAPGVSIYTTDRTGANGYAAGDYTFQAGTSFASPYAAGVAALTLSRFPFMTASQVEARLRQGCTDLGVPGYDETFGNGLVNALRAVTTAVTFRVNMSVAMRDGSFRPDLGDHVTAQGTFNTWTNADTLLDPNLDSIYCGTLPFTPYTGHMYRFWKTIRSGAGLEDADRLLDVGDEDMLLPAPYFNNQGPPVYPLFAVDTSTLDFGSVAIGETRYDTIAVINAGTDTLSVDSILCSHADFSVIPEDGVLAPADSLDVVVAFHPDSASAESGSVVFHHNAASSPDTVAVLGTGVAVEPHYFLAFPPETLVVMEPLKPGKFLKAAKRHKGLPPNWANLRTELVAQGGFAPGTSQSDSAGGLRIGLSFMVRKNPLDPLNPRWKPHTDSAKIHCWVRIGKYNFKKHSGASPDAIPKTLWTRGPYTHTGPARGLDSTGIPGSPGRKPLSKELKKLDPKKTPNALFGELLALKVGIAASVLGKTPPGLGELVFMREGSPVDGRDVKAIAARADTMMTRWNDIDRATYDSVLAAIRDINRAFAGPLDTLTWEQPVPGFLDGNLTLRGRVDVNTVPFLRLPTPFIPVRTDPTACVTDADEEYEDDREDEEGLPVPDLVVLRNFPNPFNPATTIAFTLREPSTVSISMYNLLGQECGIPVRDEEYDEGYQEAACDASGLASGVYFFRVTATGCASGRTSSGTVRMLLLK
jgi:subtilisin family serine protease